MRLKSRWFAVVGPIAAGTGMLLTTATGTAAQTGSTQNEQVVDELRQIRHLLERFVAQVTGESAPGSTTDGKTADETVVLQQVSGYSIGRVDAPVTIVEFSDLECAFCSQFHRTAFDQLQKDYIATGKVRYVARDLPLPIHPSAVVAARAARCAGEQGQYWEMRHAILTNNARLSTDSFGRFASELGIDGPAFQACVTDTNRFAALMEKDRADATSVGVAGTPSFIVGRTAVGPLHGVRIVGAVPFAQLEGTLKALLSKPAAPQ